MRLQRKLSNGDWHDDPDRMDLVDKAIEIDAWLAHPGRAPMTTRDEVLAYLATGQTIHHGTDWYAELRDADAIRPVQRPVVERVICSRCGASIPRVLAMSSSSGTVCPDCYDDASY
jgi:formylmethanofuran dehydrogenase subunit E